MKSAPRRVRLFFAHKISYVHEFFLFQEKFREGVKDATSLNGRNESDLATFWQNLLFPPALRGQRACNTLPLLGFAQEGEGGLRQRRKTGEGVLVVHKFLIQENS